MPKAEREEGGEKNDGVRRRRGSRPARSAGRTRVVRGISGAVILAAIIEIISRAGLVDERFLPAFSTVVWKLIQLFGDARFLGDLFATVSTFVLALLLASVAGIVLGILFGLSDTVYRATRTVVELIRPVPPVALIPFVILVLGNSLEMKLVIVVFAAIWPILFNSMYGVRDVEPLQKEMAHSFGKSRLQVIMQIVIPGAAPLIATGIRVSSSITLIVVITIELIAGGAKGIGAFISSARAAGNQVPEVYAGILVAGVLGLVINLLMGAAERRWFAWKTTTKEG